MHLTLKVQTSVTIYKSTTNVNLEKIMSTIINIIKNEKIVKVSSANNVGPKK